MRWKGRQGSENVRDLRGARRPMAIGGGLGGVGRAGSGRFGGGDELRCAAFHLPRARLW